MSMTKTNIGWDPDPQLRAAQVDGARNVLLGEFRWPTRADEHDLLARAERQGQASFPLCHPSIVLHASLNEASCFTDRELACAA
jgi:hypothetical protein